MFMITYNIYGQYKQNVLQKKKYKVGHYSEKDEPIILILVVKS